MRYWILKTVDDKDRSTQSNDGYEDVLSLKYVYDSNVANSKQIQTNDWVILSDKKELLGYAKISRVKSYPAKKEIRRCPICGDTSYGKRTTKLPEYRCSNKHEFDKPDSKEVDIIKYEAYYGESYQSINKGIPISNLKPYYDKGYNGNMSIQSVDGDYFKNIDTDIINKLNKSVYYPSPIDSIKSNEEELDYEPDNIDTRMTTNRQIKVRRGQPKFRKKLLSLYNQQCCVTGCSIIHLLEAAHIKPYRGEKDNNPSNGLLLRADIHTLFDLDMLGIHPENLTIHLNDEVKKDKYEKLEGIKITGKPSKEALDIKWSLFSKNK